MSKGLFASSKATAMFAGGIALFAIVASLAAQSFVSQTQVDDRDIFQDDDAAQSAPVNDVPAPVEWPADEDVAFEAEASAGGGWADPLAEEFHVEDHPESLYEDPGSDSGNFITDVD